jgi:hypothetical protein
MAKYTDAMVEELKTIGKLDYNSANAFAQKHGIEIRSVIAKARAYDLPYQAKDPKQDKKPIARQKADIVKSILAELKIELPSLVKMTVVDLEKLEVELKGAAE